MAASHGYSGKPLYQKLGLKPGMRCLTIKAPDHYGDLIADATDVAISSRFHTADVVHLFCHRRSDLDQNIDTAIRKVVPGGMLWVSWPKKTSALCRDLAEGDFRTVILPIGWVDVKVCAVDADWSGLKFLKRRSRSE